MVDECVRRMVRIPAGEFLMGSDDGDDNERPLHPVYLDDFFIAPYAVTNAEYYRFVRDTGYRPIDVHTLPSVVAPDLHESFAQLASRYVWQGGRPPAGMEDHPVTLVQHRDAVEYCRWLAAVADKPFRLPTEAEWEKAARGGLENKPYPWGDGIDPSRANYLPDLTLKSRRGTQPVGSFAPNGYRLFDMAGNVWQWVSDWYEPAYYCFSEYRNPAGPTSGRLRTVRGGSWVNDDVAFLRSPHRHAVPPDTYSYSIGFRVVYSSV